MFNLSPKNSINIKFVEAITPAARAPVVGSRAFSQQVGCSNLMCWKVLYILFNYSVPPKKSINTKFGGIISRFVRAPVMGS